VAVKSSELGLRAKLKHHCGVVGLSSLKEINLPQRLFYPLFALQHRGQESCGLTYSRKGQLITYKDLGLVSQVLSHYLREEHPSQIGIGHVRYSTQGANKLENAQPFAIACQKGNIAFAHNGNISNSSCIRKMLFRQGAIFQSTSDSELILHLIAHSSKNTFEESLLEAVAQLEGAYAGLFIHNEKLYALRDPLGFRPLVMGKTPELTAFASETCALEMLGINQAEEVLPGELIVVDKGEVRRQSFCQSTLKSQCIFELIYFARPDSTVFGVPVHLVRKKMGAALAAVDPYRADLVIPVPDSGNSAALGYALASGLPFEFGLTRNHYSGRTFIQPSQDMREFGVRLKLHPIKRVIAGKRIVIIDDSMVRGTTSRILIKMLKQAGAREVHLRLASPELKYPCFFGIDIPIREELISNRMTPSQIADYIGADSVFFLPLDSLKACVENPSDFCYACFNGAYPCPVSNENMRRKD